LCHPSACGQARRRNIGFQPVRPADILSAVLRFVAAGCKPAGRTG
jgi:hypothetical protein